MASGAPAAHPERERRREPTDLYASVLEVVKRFHGEARITRVSYGAGMPVDRLRRLVDHLVASGLLTARPVHGRPAYEITARGQEFLNAYWKMRGYVELLTAALPDRRQPAGHRS